MSLPEGSRPCGAGCGMVSSIRAGSNLGALVPAWDNVCCYPEGSGPCGAGCGMVSSIRAGSNLGALVPS